MELGIRAEKTGLFNLAGDGVMTIHDIAQRLGKPVLTLPAWLVRSALAVGHSLGLTRYGPSQLNFLRYRPVLDNTALKREFGYQPQKTSHQTFDFYASHALGIKAPTPLANFHANTSNTKGTR
jgi:UDP-glucose 4-epimerase